MKPAMTFADVLADLLRWQFGELLAQRAGWRGADPDAVTQAVQDFRRRILSACLRQAGLDPGAGYGLPADQGAWEQVLVDEFLDGLRAIAPLGGAEDKLKRFAYGQFFKYSRRVALLMDLNDRLPAVYAPKAG